MQKTEPAIYELGRRIEALPDYSPTDFLHLHYMAWLKRNDLPEHSADELLMCAAGDTISDEDQRSVTEEQRAWLQAFTVLWDEANAAVPIPQGMLDINLQAIETAQPEIKPAESTEDTNIDDAGVHRTPLHAQPPRSSVFRIHERSK